MCQTKIERDEGKGKGRKGARGRERWRMGRKGGRREEGKEGRRTELVWMTLTARARAREQFPAKAA